MRTLVRPDNSWAALLCGELWDKWKMRLDYQKRVAKEKPDAGPAGMKKTEFVGSHLEIFVNNGCTVQTVWSGYTT